MNNSRFILSAILILTLGITFTQNVISKTNKTNNESLKKYKINKTNEQWKKILTPEAFHILRERGTEMAYTGKYYNNHEKGVYYCAACSTRLFDSKTKFDSGTGWPSFYQPAIKANIEERQDFTYGMSRTEVNCMTCGGHLGHVFDDGPQPTGLRYCINSDALIFKKQ